MSPNLIGKRKIADAKRAEALHALLEAIRTGLAVHVTASAVACRAWALAEKAAGRAEP